MFSFLTSYKWLWELGAIVAIFIAVAYGIHTVLEYEQKLGYDKAVAEYIKKQLVAEQAARAKEQDLNNQITEARNAAIRRDQEISKLTNILNATTKRLHDTTATIRNKLPQDSPTTVLNTADAALSALGECTDRYTEMATTADGYANEIKLLQESWPK